MKGIILTALELCDLKGTRVFGLNNCVDWLWLCSATLYKTKDNNDSICMLFSAIFSSQVNHFSVIISFIIQGGARNVIPLIVHVIHFYYYKNI